MSADRPREAVLLIGPTSAGKTPLGDYLAQCGMHGRRCHHFDFGHELRTIAMLDSPPVSFSMQEQQFIRDLLEKGLLLEDRHFPVAEKIVRKFFTVAAVRADDLIVLNGLPRHAGQARDMAALVTVTHLFVLDCSVEDVCARITRDTGGDRKGRTDDAPEMVRKKLDLYASRTEPLIDHYRLQGSRIVRVPVDPDATAEVVAGRFLRHLSS